jgi:hypothetical protein
MFQPFSQENPLHTGTGLGLAIVNSIVKSDGIRGKVDVYSTEGAGTEIRVTIETELPSRSSSARYGGEGTSPLTQKSLPTVKVFPACFNLAHRGQELLREVLSSYIIEWWNAKIADDPGESNVLLVNEDFSVFEDLITRKDTSRPVVLLASHRGDNELSTTISSFEAIGGLCCVVYKPVRPSHLYHALERAISNCRNQGPSESPTGTLPPLWRSPLAQRPSLIPSDEAARAINQNLAHESPRDLSANVKLADGLSPSYPAMRRRHSEETRGVRRGPPLTRSITLHPVGDTERPRALHETSQYSPKPLAPLNTRQASNDDRRCAKSARVLVVEDNDINRGLLTQWLKKQVRGVSFPSPQQKFMLLSGL